MPTTGRLGTNGGLLERRVAQDSMGFVSGQGGAASGAIVEESGESQEQAGIYVSRLQSTRSSEYKDGVPC
jgi:hypothetical protein